ncbi:MAG: TonB-dependent receptor [Saprospiraceae bacterium]|nr:TonB-dependent receptor [Saprospiraceae bacterium]
MKLIYTFYFILGLFSFLSGQTITFLHPETKEPLEYVMLSSKNPKLVLYSNASGQAEISGLSGSERIEINAPGCKMVIKSYRELQEMNFAIPLEASTIEIGEIVVSASRWGQFSGNIPSKVSKISSKEMALQNPQTAADLLGTSGEVFIQKSQQGGGSPMIRGFSANRLLYTVDGVRMNTAIFRAGNLQNVISLDPLSIENTEVFFGPGSIMYGSDAIGGVMGFQTLTPKISLDEKVKVNGKAFGRYSSVNRENTFHFDANVGWKKFSMLSSITHSEFGDLRMGSKGPAEYLRPFYVIRMDSADLIVSNPDPSVQKPTGYSQINLMQKFRFRLNEFWDFQYGFHYSRTTEYSRYDRLIETAANGLPRSAVWNYGPQIWSMHHFQIQQNANYAMYDRMTLRLAQQGFEESRIDRNFSGGQRYRLRTNLETVDASSVNLDFEKHWSRHQFYYGAEYILNKVNSNGSAVDIRNAQAISVADRYPKSDWQSVAAYLSYQYKLSKSILLQAGLRQNMFDIHSDFSRHLRFFPFDFTKSNLRNSSTNGSLGWVYRPEESLKISMNVSTGFRAPNVDDIGKIFDFTAGDVVVPNASLKAEHAYNAEINLSKVLGEWIKLDLTGFYTYLDQAMVRRTFQVNGQDSILYDGVMSRVYAIQNAAYARIYGINLGIEIHFNKHFAFISKYNYQYGLEEMDSGMTSRSRHAAPAFGISKLKYKQDKIQLEWNVQYSASVKNEDLNEEEKQKPFIYAKDVNGNPYSPGWYTLNFKAMYQWNEAMSVSAGLDNITDQRYRPYSSGIVAGGRNLVVSVLAKF